MWTGYQLFQDAKFPDFGSMRAALLDQRSGIDALSAGARVRIQPSRGELPEPEAVALPAGWQAGDAADLKPVPRVRSDGRLLYPGFLRWLGRFGMAFARFPWKPQRFRPPPAETAEEPNG